MKEQIDILIKLQEIEVETSSIQSILDEVPKRLGDLDVGLKDFEKNIEDEEARVHELKKKYPNLSKDTRFTFQSWEERET